MTAETDLPSRDAPHREWLLWYVGQIDPLTVILWTSLAFVWGLIRRVVLDFYTMNMEVWPAREEFALAALVMVAFHATVPWVLPLVVAEVKERKSS